MQTGDRLARTARMAATTTQRCASMFPEEYPRCSLAKWPQFAHDLLRENGAALHTCTRKHTGWAAARPALLRLGTLSPRRSGRLRKVDAKTNRPPACTEQSCPIIHVSCVATSNVVEDVMMRSAPDDGTGPARWSPTGEELLRAAGCVAKTSIRWTNRLISHTNRSAGRAVCRRRDFAPQFVSCRPHKGGSVRRTTLKVDSRGPIWCAHQRLGRSAASN